MCIAIPSPGQQNSGNGSRWWRYLSASAARLLGLSAAAQLVALVLASAVFPTADPLAAILASSFIALGTALLGVSLTRIPQRLGALPLSYPMRVVLFALITGGALLALLSSWQWAGQALVLAGWLAALRTLWWALEWAPKRLSHPLRHEFRLLATLAAALGVILVGPPPFSAIFAAIGLVLILASIWPLVVKPLGQWSAKGFF